MNRRLLLVMAFALGALARPSLLGGQKVTATIGAIDQGPLWLTTNFRGISTCDVSGGSCTRVQQADLGANSYPVHRWVANGHVYWVSESGASRLIQTCPRTGCGTGGFEGDASLLRWANINAGTLESCVLPDCTRVDTQKRAGVPVTRAFQSAFSRPPILLMLREDVHPQA